MTARLSLALVVLAVWSHDARALTQPNGAAIPSAMGCNGGQPVGLAAVFACQCTQAGVCNIGAPCASATSCDNGQHGTCETTLWHNFNDNTCIPSNQSGLDPAKDASLMPATFHPDCGLDFTVVSRGTAIFKNAFGWYNVTGQAPAASDLHLMLDCNAKAGDHIALDVKTDPAYKGGDIGFFLVTPDDHAKPGSCASGDCCATVARATSGQGWIYYSERQYNPDGAVMNPFIHLVVYDSKITTNKFYFAWEDRYGSPDTDFTDLVTSVDGIQCTGGGLDCNTGLLGQCARGLSSCQNGVVTCHGLVMPSSEVCDGLDNDCNGKVDDGAPCPPEEVCVNGQCVPHCAQSSEFACASQLACDPKTGVCVDPACNTVQCPDGKVCRGGNCVGPCDGIACPHGTECMQGACIDPCAQVHCPPGQACKEGICLAACNQCGGITCGSGLTCDATSGTCTDLSCATPCPAGTWCDHGTCQDSCTGATCPPGQTCSAGACVPVNGAAPDAGVGSGGGGTGGSGGNGTVPDTASAGGCGCGPMAKASSPPTHMSSLFAFALLALWLRRKKS
jgi:hypothetical protein